MIIPAKPFLPIRLMSQQSPNDAVYPWSNMLFYNSGSDAMIAALEVFKVPQKSRVALPALICHSVPKMLEKYGFTPVFFDITDGLNAPYRELLVWAEEGRIDAVILVDYFGFLASEQSSFIVELQKKGCVVIEDRCHSALSRPSNNVPDAIIYSIRKSLVVKDGGALFLRSKTKVLERGKSWLWDIVFVIKRLVEQVVIVAGILNLYKASITVFWKKKVDKRPSCSRSISARDPSRIKPITPSWLLRKQLLNSELIEQFSERRRSNYIYLKTCLAVHKIYPIFTLDNDEVAPQVLPFLDSSGKIVGYLREHGVGAYRWPGDELPDIVGRYPWKYPNAVRFSHELVCLPIHQSIQMKHIDHMSRLIGAFNRSLTGC